MSYVAVRIRLSGRRGPFGGNEACPVAAHGRVPEGRIFRCEPQINVRYVLLHILPYAIIF
jgi:hypothetical protein